ncbi:phosphoserine phosphatase [Oceanobacillus zhaokaii]|uniref:Phosphoserine phosphatase n=1 Tax=Oceanobacillus zhaokaii TaxID=2052660 RepID=A0A345PDG3_9BACI|nr:PP2C family protein-serine/threonine phosphatase [Oceanobacillus zhaokaii]AXI08043.1 phosphoserine phosphatase [Oceanobacillus zhaokaii]
MDKIMDLDIAHYKTLLKDYITNQSEQSLYGVELVSKSFIKNNILPDEIVNLHIQALGELYPNLNLDVKHSMDFLLEAMISYGLSLQEVQMLREEQLALKSEISVAASMQETLLGTTIPEVEGLDIGVISVPANQMNGDYHHFVKGNDGSIGIAMADVIGKGIPAALCMSMIKYAIDSFPEDKMSPGMILKNLNRVVERNVDPSMFITMVYSQYHPLESKLKYASAGHEPGFYYNAKNGTFVELETEGLLLGVLPDTDYKQYELEIHENDMLIFLTDGVTECRDGERFIEMEEVLNVIKQYIDLPAQELVTNVYKHFERLQNFQLADDFTLLILRKEV